MARTSSNEFSSIMKTRSSLGILSLKTNSSLNFVYFNKSATLEMRYLVILKKTIKKIKHSVPRVTRKKVTTLFLSIKKNYYYSKKSKNSRMGKGKGKITRPAIRVKKFKPFIYFKGIYTPSIEKFTKVFAEKTNLSLRVFIVENDRTFFGLGRGNHPYFTLINSKLV